MRQTEDVVDLNRRNLGPEPSKNSAHVVRWAAMLSLVLTFPQVIAASKNDGKESVDPGSLIGMTVVGFRYPDGWKQVGRNDSSRHLGTTVRLERERQGAVVLGRYSTRWGVDVPAKMLILDAIQVDQPSNPFRFSRFCYFPERGDGPVTDIFANVRFHSYCESKTTTIIRAWRPDFNTGKFELLNDTHGLTCEFGLVLHGEPDNRRGCPGADGGGH